jgi:hypothetical protein
MTVDILTKVLPHWKVSQHAHRLGLCHPCRGVIDLEGAGALTDECKAPEGLEGST